MAVNTSAGSTPIRLEGVDSEGDSIVVEAVIVESHSDESPVEPTRPSATNATPVPNTSLARLALGSALIAAEEVSERAALSDAQYEIIARTPESVLLAEAEWDNNFGSERFQNARHMAIGMVAEGKTKTSGAIGFASEVTGTAGRIAGRFLGPVWNSIFLAPIRKPWDAVTEAGEEQIQEWIAYGRMEEARSREIAERSLTNLVNESVEEITTSDELQEIVQQVVASQGMGMFEQVLSEIRERLFTLDLLLSGLFGRAGQDTPPFRDDYLEGIQARDPRLTSADLARSMGGRYAGFVTRFVAFVVDMLLAILVAVMTSAFITAVITLFGLQGITSDFLSSGRPIARVVSSVIASLGILTFAFYMVVSWFLTGATIGDALFGVRVVTVDGQRLSLSRSVVRIIGFFLSGLLLGIGFIWAIFDRKRQGWHDKLARTTVVYDWPAQPDERFMRRRVAEEMLEAVDYSRS